jgi:quercetin dioxygenase-like cupin family protein
MMKVMSYRDVEEETSLGEGANDVTIRWLISDKDGAENFFMRRLEVRGWTPYHSHTHEHQVYILSGQGVLKGDGVEHDLAPGVFCWVPSGETHQFKNTGREPLSLLCLIPSSNG